LPNECWQSDFTHYRLTRPDGTPGVDAEVLSWLDDLLPVRLVGDRAHPDHRTDRAGHLPGNRCPARDPGSTLTDNGMVFTTRLAGGRGGRNVFEHELRRHT
jgi:hypothetical protein